MREQRRRQSLKRADMVRLHNEVSINQHLWTHEPTRPLEETNRGVCVLTQGNRLRMVRRP